ncbi:MAG: polysaccharide biosynthesis tyrosine autokinase [Lachnoclostridium sp.]|nr:polysaccharide biosynthesis tyrosine autokinase [Lachnoclostridium sp.]
MAKKRSEQINFREIFKGYLSKWYVFLASVIVFGIIGYLFTRTINPEYGVRANILIQEEQNNLLSGMGDIGQLFGSSAKVDDEIFVLSSHSIYREVAKNLGINKLHVVSTGFLRKELAYPEFPVDVTASEAITDTLATTLHFKVKVNKEGIADISVKAKRKTVAELDDTKLPATIDTPYGQFTVSATDTYPKGESVKTTISYTGYNAAAEDLADEIVNDIASRKGNVINLAIDIENADLGCAILNDVIACYNTQGITESNVQAAATLRFIEDRLKLIAEDLNDTEIGIQKYKEANKIIGVDVEAEYQTEKRGRLEAQLTSAQAYADMLKLTIDFIRDPENRYSLIPVAIDNEGVQAVLKGYNDMILKYIELTDKAKPNSVAVQQFQKQLDAMRDNVSNTVDAAYDRAIISLNKIMAEHNSNVSSLGSVPAQERAYIDLRRQQEIKQQLYLFMLQRKEETSIVLANAKPKGMIVDEAYVLSKPLGISKIVVLGIFVIIGLIVPVVFFYLRKLIRNRFDSREEVESKISVPILGEMCADRSGQKLVVTQHAHSSAAELFRLIRSNLLFMLNNADDKVVLMTSSTSGEGKSFISINLAQSLALLGKKVLLIGMDIRKPRLADYLDINPQFGLTQYLSTDTITLDKIILPADDSHSFDVIVAGPVPPNPAELLASGKVDDLFRRLRSMYDYIIVDTAPVGMVSDTFTLARISDATIYVCRINHTPYTDLNFIQDIYDEKRLRKLSVIVNGTTSKKAYGYGYGHTKG